MRDRFRQAISRQTHSLYTAVYRATPTAKSIMQLTVMGYLIAIQKGYFTNCFEQRMRCRVKRMRFQGEYFEGGLRCYFPRQAIPPTPVSIRWRDILWQILFFFFFTKFSSNKCPKSIHGRVGVVWMEDSEVGAH